MVAVPFPLSYLNPCMAMCIMMVLHTLLFTINTQTFQTTLTNPMHMYPFPPLGISTIVVHPNASGMYPSRNFTFVILTSLSHFSVSGTFYLVASLRHIFKCYALILDVRPARPACSFRTAAAISSPSGDPYMILTCCTSIGIGSPSSGSRL